VVLEVGQVFNCGGRREAAEEVGVRGVMLMARARVRLGREYIVIQR
jgi:hypothetical protein